MVDSQFVTDSELNSYINSSIAELHDILVQTYNQEYSIKDVTFNTVASQSEYQLSSIITDNDFYKLRGIDAKLNGDDYFTLKPFNFNERNRFQNFGVWDYLGITNVRYRIVGGRLIFSPIPDAVIEIKVWYVPLAAKLEDDADTLDDINQYAEYVIVDAAIKMLQKEESDVSVFLAQKAALKRRIEEAAQNRDVGDSESVSDIYIENDDFLYGRTRG
jgi:hypothetical protein